MNFQAEWLGVASTLAGRSLYSPRLFVDTAKIKQKILDNVKHEPGPLDTPCWIWQRCTHDFGYGQIRINKRNYRVHRLAYMLWVGLLSDHIFVCHKCDVPSCCNPDHLFLGTQQANMKDCFKKGRGIIPKQIGEQNNHAKLSEQDVLKMRKEYKTGTTVTQLMSKYRLSRSNIINALNGTNWAHLPEACDTRAEGSKCHNAKIKEDDIKNIFNLYKQGKSQREIAEAYGVFQTTVSAILTRRTWKHVKI